MIFTDKRHKCVLGVRINRYNYYLNNCISIKYTENLKESERFYSKSRKNGHPANAQ
jgi:hypothetical protein